VESPEYRETGCKVRVSQRGAEDGSSRDFKKISDKPATPCEGSKKAVILALLGRQGGATLAEIMTATGWNRHIASGIYS